MLSRTPELLGATKYINYWLVSRMVPFFFCLWEEGREAMWNARTERAAALRDYKLQAGQSGGALYLLAARRDEAAHFSRPLACFDKESGGARRKSVRAKIAGGGSHLGPERQTTGVPGATAGGKATKEARSE